MEKESNDTIKLKKPSNQVIISKIDDKFLIGKRFNKSIAVVSPFEKVEDTIISNFEVPNNRSRRVQILYNMIPRISKYSVSDDGVNFDCVQSISERTDIFNYVKNGVNQGFIHFDITSFRKREEGSNKLTTYVDVNPRLMFAKLEDQEIIDDIVLEKLEHKFKTLKFKAFSAILEKGFILCTVDKRYTTLYIVINKPDLDFVGNCVKKEISNIINNISPLWPIFRIANKEKRLGLFLNESITKDYKHINCPILLKCEREMGSNSVISTCIGVNISIT